MREGTVKKVLEYFIGKAGYGWALMREGTVKKVLEYFIGKAGGYGH